MSEIAESLAQELAEPIKAELNNRSDQIITSLVGGVGRIFLRSVFPFILRAVNPILGIGFSFLLDKFGSISLNDLVSLIMKHMRSQGQEPHPSLAAFRNPEL